MPKYLLSRTGYRSAYSAPVRALQRLAAIGQLLRYGEGRSALRPGQFG